MDGKSRVCRLIALLEGQETAAQIEENSVVFFIAPEWLFKFTSSNALKLGWHLPLSFWDVG